MHGVPGARVSWPVTCDGKIPRYRPSAGVSNLVIPNMNQLVGDRWYVSSWVFLSLEIAVSQFTADKLTNGLVSALQMWHMWHINWVNQKHCKRNLVRNIWNLRLADKRFSRLNQSFLRQTMGAEPSRWGFVCLDLMWHFPSKSTRESWWFHQDWECLEARRLHWTRSSKRWIWGLKLRPQKWNLELFTWCC